MRCKASCFGPQIGERRSLLVIALVLASIAPLMRAWCLMLSNERERRTVHGGGLVHIRDQTHRASGRGWHRAIGRRRRRLLRQRARRNHQRSLHADKMLENFESHPRAVRAAISSLRDSPSSRGLLESRRRIMERRPMQQATAPYDVSARPAFGCFSYPTLPRQPFRSRRRCRQRQI